MLIMGWSTARFVGQQNRNTGAVGRTLALDWISRDTNTTFRELSALGLPALRVPLSSWSWSFTILGAGFLDYVAAYYEDGAAKTTAMRALLLLDAKIRVVSVATLVAMVYSKTIAFAGGALLSVLYMALCRFTALIPVDAQININFYTSWLALLTPAIAGNYPARLMICFQLLKLCGADYLIPGIPYKEYEQDVVVSPITEAQRAKINALDISDIEINPAHCSKVVHLSELEPNHNFGAFASLVPDRDLGSLIEELETSKEKDLFAILLAAFQKSRFKRTHLEKFLAAPKELRALYAQIIVRSMLLEDPELSLQRGLYLRCERHRYTLVYQEVKDLYDDAQAPEAPAIVKKLDWIEWTDFLLHGFLPSVKPRHENRNELFRFCTQMALTEYDKRVKEMMKSSSSGGWLMLIESGVYRFKA
jgi:hypothetical protein